MEYPQIMFSFYPLFNDKKQLITSLKKSLEVFQRNISLSPDIVIFSGKNGKHPINGFDDPIIVQGDYLNLYIYGKDEKYRVYTSVYEQHQYELTLGFDFYTPFLVENFRNEETISFFKEQTLLLSSTNTANALDTELSLQIVQNLYEPFDFTGRNSDFIGFSWLNYLSPEEMTLNGGKALYDLPYLTKVEPLGEGIFIQVGETSNDARTKQGKQQLFKATEAWWEMMQKKGR